jgi:Holliday junction resolvase RusA-like endonuclease
VGGGAAVIKFFVQGLPRAMSVSRTVRAGNKQFQTRANNDWALLVGQVGREYAPPAPLKGPVTLTAEFRLPRPKTARKADVEPIKRPDLDNLFHKLSDQWNGVFYDDDSQVVTVELRKSYALDGRPGVEIIVAPLGDRS